MFIFQPGDVNISSLEHRELKLEFVDHVVRLSDDRVQYKLEHELKQLRESKIGTILLM